MTTRQIIGVFVMKTVPKLFECFPSHSLGSNIAIAMATDASLRSRVQRKRSNQKGKQGGRAVRYLHFHYFITKYTLNISCSDILTVSIYITEHAGM